MKRDWRIQKRKYQREWRKRRRLEYLQGQVCATCGEPDITKLELDHIDPATKYTHNIWSYSREWIEHELRKCQWLCRLCHSAKHAAEKAARRQHGTSTMYRHGCRCSLCRQARAAAHRDYSERQKRLGASQ